MTDSNFDKRGGTDSLLPVVFLVWVLGGAHQAVAQEIDIRISVKYVYFGDIRPAGPFSNTAAVQAAIDQVNERTLRRWNRGYRYIITEFQDIIGASTFSDLTGDAEFKSLETTAEADRGRFFWRDNAINLYIVNSFTLNGSTVGGAAAIPSNSPSDTGFRLVVFTANAGPPDIIWAHELGHHFDLYHTFNNDNVADTLADPNPLVCMGVPSPDGRPCSTGGNFECCCATKISMLNTVSMNGGWTQQQYDDIRFNNMSYHCGLTLDNLRMTPGQLDRWTDATRRFFYNQGGIFEVSGLTYFVDRNNPTGLPYSGYSTDPHKTVAGGVAAANPSGGDIVLIRTGNYNEPMTITKPLTLRASRGNVTIGQ